MIGVPGAGMSWIIGTLRTWSQIWFSGKEYPYHSSEAEITACEPSRVSKLISNCLEIEENGAFGTSAALALSGAASGVIKGMTIHNALQLPINFNQEIKRGDFPFPIISPSLRGN